MLKFGIIGAGGIARTMAETIREMPEVESTAIAARDLVQDSSGNAGNSVAAYLEYCRLYGPAHDCLIPMCGAGLKSDH